MLLPVQRYCPLIVPILILSLMMGCGQTSNKPLQLILWTSPDDKVLLEKQLAEFSRQNRETKVQLITCNTENECKSEFDFRFQKGKAPDVCMISSRNFMDFIQSNKIRSLQTYDFNKNLFLDRALEAFVNENQLYALPCGWSALMLYYNRAIFERHGIPLPDSFWDWGDLLNAAQSLTVWDEDRSKITQYGFEVSISPEAWIPFLWQNDGELIRENGVWSLTDPQFSQSNLQALEFYTDLVRRYKVSPKPIKSELTVGNFFITQKAAMTLGYREFGSRLLKESRQTEWDITVLPSKQKTASILNVFGYAISMQSNQPANAWKLISFLTRETSQATMIQNGRYAPSYQTLLTSKIFLDFPGNPVVRNSVLVNSLSFSRSIPQIPYWNEASNILADEMLAIMLNPQLSIRASMEQMQARLDEQKLLHRNLKQKSSD